jgi:lipopolysaccharide transport system ATP-binding protein
LGKQFRIGSRERYLTLRDSLARALAAPVQGLRAALGRNGKEEHSNLPTFQPSNSDILWALRDISFEIRQGERIGLIGRNGAGKSTLLKILARITRPTSGRAVLRGRVGSLLEVGTGMHSELTGRENVYLSGAILGMKKREIERKFDEILAFAGVEKFVDTPLKHYSTGMQLRLAFAVAAHLEPEILLVDEVLAVGDLEFQKKCLGKMEEVSHGGRTVIFVSHQMGQIRRLCEKVIWLNGGRIEQTGTVPKVLAAYEAAMTSARGAARPADAPTVKARFLSWNISSARGDEAHMLSTIGPVEVEFHLRVNRALRHAHHGVALYDADGKIVWGWATDHLNLNEGEHALAYQFPMLPLRPGTYSWLISVWENMQVVDLWHCLPELIVATENFQHAKDEWGGVLNVPTTFIAREHVREGAPG